MGKFLSRPGAAKQLQQALAAARHLGGSPYYTGPIDGILGPASQAAIVAFRRDHDLSPTVEIDNTMLRLLDLGPALITEPGTLGNIIALPIIELAAKAVLPNVLKGLFTMSFLTGYKTYITAALILLCSAAETFAGIDIPGFNLDLTAAIGVAAGLIFARVGAKTEATKASGQ